jgi:hypothetical protein
MPGRRVATVRRGVLCVAALVQAAAAAAAPPAPTVALTAVHSAPGPYRPGEGALTITAETLVGGTAGGRRALQVTHRLASVATGELLAEATFTVPLRAAGGGRLRVAPR